MIGAVFAILPTLGFQEMLVIIVLGVLLFGRNLPDVGRKVGRTVAQLRRGMQEFKDQMNRDDSVRELKDSFRETRDELRGATTVPRALANPGKAVRDAARKAIDEAGADAATDDVAGSKAADRLAGDPSAGNGADGDHPSGGDAPPRA